MNREPIDPTALPAPATASPAEVWTPERIRALGAVTDLPTAASIFNLSRTVAYDLVRQGRFPVPVIRAGARYRVPVAAILTLLRLTDDAATGPT
jgi:hypothetical protein